jgi:HK97 gp10 family phage protein
MIRIKQDSGNKKVFLKLDMMGQEVRHAIERGYTEGARVMRKSLQKGLKFGGRSGKVYTHKRPGGGSFTRTSSAPGEYPQRIFGTLRGAVAFKVFTYKKMIFGIKNPSKGIDTTYAKYLEEGTRKMAKRKLVGYTVNRMHQQFRNIVIKEINRQIKGK